MRLIAVLVGLFALIRPTWGRPLPAEPPILDVRPTTTVPTSSAAVETVYYGGTTWAPDSMRWEALRDSVWTFDTGVGSSINTGFNTNKPPGYHQSMEGWLGLDRTLPTMTYFRRSSQCAISGSYSAWAGVTVSEANDLCYAAGRGYGNDWDIRFRKVFNYPGSGTVSLSYAYSVECEAYFDYMYVCVDTVGDGSGEISLETYTGAVSGTGSLNLIPRHTPGPFAIVFRVTSDYSYSDEDGLASTTCGHSAVDNITLGGAVMDLTDFEIGTNGWAVYTPPSGLGDYSHVADLASLAPPMVACPTLQDSVLVFFTETNQHVHYSDNLAVSPWIDLKRGGDDWHSGRIMAFDMYAVTPICEFNFVQLKVRWYPWVCPVSGEVTTSPFTDEGFVYYYGDSPICTSIKRDFSSVVPAGAEQVQVAWGVKNVCHITFSCGCIGPGMNGNQTPYFDNIRFGVYGQAITAVPDRPEPPIAGLSAAEPNPVRSSTRIAFATTGAGTVRLEIFDVAGRLVRVLYDGSLPAGSHEAVWNVRDGEARRVAPGIFFYRLTTETIVVSRKLVVSY